MAKANTTPAAETENKAAEEKPEKATQNLQEMQDEIRRLKGQLDEQKKANAELKRNSIYSPSPYGSAGDYERVKEASAEAAEKGENPWTIKISVKAPRIGKGEDSYWLSVNGRTMQVPANEKYFEMALPFAECLVEEIRNRNRAADYVDGIEVYDPETNPRKADNV